MGDSGMSIERDRLLREEGSAFWGTVTASVSHEINNVISIIHEYSGLIDDLVSIAETGRPVENEKLTRIAERIAHQVSRGKGITGRLNRLAHSVDAPCAPFSVNRVMEDVVDLARRFSDLKAVRLVSAFPEKETMITGNPILLYQAVFTSVRLALDRAGKDDAARIAFRCAGPEVEVTVECPQEIQSEPVPREILFLKCLLEELGGRAEVNTKGSGRDVIRLSVPMTPAGNDDSAEVGSR